MTRTNVTRGSTIVRKIKTHKSRSSIGLSSINIVLLNQKRKIFLFKAVLIVRVALLKPDYLRDDWAESISFGAQIKAENLRISIPIAASKQEIQAIKRKRSIFSWISLVFWSALFKCAPILSHHRF